MITQEQINYLKKLYNELNIYKNSLDEYVRKIIFEYIEIDRDLNFNYRNNNYDIIYWKISGDCIIGQWEDIWPDGTYKEDFIIPCEFFYNPRKLEEFRQQKEQQKKDAEAISRENSIFVDKQELERLAEKYNVQLVDKKCIS